MSVFHNKLGIYLHGATWSTPTVMLLPQQLPLMTLFPIELQCINIIQTVWRALIIDPLRVSEGSNYNGSKIMSCIVSYFTNAAPTVLNYNLRSTVLSLKAGFCVSVPHVRLPKSHGKREGLVSRCLRDNRGLSQSLKDGDNACRLQSKGPFTVGMECLTKAVMQISVWMFILLLTLNATLWHLFLVLVQHWHLSESVMKEFVWLYGLSIRNVLFCLVVYLISLSSCCRVLFAREKNEVVA